RSCSAVKCSPVLKTVSMIACRCEVTRRFFCAINSKNFCFAVDFGGADMGRSIFRAVSKSTRALDCTLHLRQSSADCQRVNVELINTGSELMLGFVTNTHQQWLCRELSQLGHVVTRQVAVADEGGAIQQAVREALGRADLVITTGG